MRIAIDPSSAEPIYEQIRAALAEQILRGDLPAGSALPSIRALARDLRVSVITTTRAYNELVADGLAYSAQGRGVFVREQDAAEVRDRALARIDTALADAIAAARTASIPASTIRARLDAALEKAGPR